MSFWAVVFIVLMILWLFSGGYYCYHTPAGPTGPVVWGMAFIPWCCVAILGYIVLTGTYVVVGR